MYISATSINTIFVIQSDTEDPLGSWTQYDNVQHDGQQIVGYDPHAINLPNGTRYLTWSTSFHAAPSISIIKMLNITHAVPGTPLSAIVVPDEYYEMNGMSLINRRQLSRVRADGGHVVEIPPGNYSFLGTTCCGTSNSTPFNAPVVEAPSSWIVNSTVNLGYSANWYADASKSSSHSHPAQHLDIC